jgi:hypothetical protein
VFWNYPDIHSLAGFLSDFEEDQSPAAKKDDQTAMSDEDVNNELDALIKELL